MKDIITKNRSLLDETEELLNIQIQKEGYSSAVYLSMASWCEMKGFENSAEFLYQHSEEERMHMLKFFHYINEVGGHAIHPQITDIPTSFVSLRDVFEQVLSHEIDVTRSIHALVDHCFSNKDFTTHNFLQWFVLEQREEETLARRVLEIFDIIGEEGIGLWTIDKEIGKLAGEGAESDNSLSPDA